MKYFIAVVQEKNFTKAAEKLFIAQPPLSRAIQNLEEELEVSLLIRNTRSLELTEAGKYFYENAKKIVQSEINLKNMTRQIGGASKNLRIGYVGSAIYGKLADCLKHFRKNYPDINLELEQMNTLTQIETLKTQKIDIGFGRLKIIDKEVERIILKEEKLYAAFPQGHDMLGDIDNSVSLADIVDEPLILFPDTPQPNFLSSIIDIFAMKMLSPSNLFAPVRDAHSALGLVMGGLGISIVNEGMVNTNNNNVVFIPIKDDIAITPIILSYRKYENYTIIRDFIQIANDIFTGETNFGNNN